MACQVHHDCGFQTIQCTEQTINMAAGLLGHIHCEAVRFVEFGSAGVPHCTLQGCRACKSPHTVWSSRDGALYRSFEDTTGCSERNPTLSSGGHRGTLLARRLTNQRTGRLHATLEERALRFAPRLAPVKTVAVFFLAALADQEQINSERLSHSVTVLLFGCSSRRGGVGRGLLWSITLSHLNELSNRLCLA